MIVFVALLILFERQRHKRSVYFCRDEWCVLEERNWTVHCVS